MTGDARPSRHFRRAWATAALAAGLASPAFAQSPIDRAKAAAAVAEQKADASVAQAIADANKLGKSNAAKAVERLKQVQTGLDISAEISSVKRKELTATIQATIDVLEGRGPTPDADPNAPATKKRTREAVEAAATEAKEVADALAKAAKLADAGRMEEARGAMVPVVRKYPANPSVVASNQQDFYRTQIQAEKDLAKQYSAAWVEHMRGINRDSIPVVNDITFPDAKKWKDLTARRLTPAVKLTPKEEKLLESLNTTLTADFRGRPFKEALQDLSNKIQQPIHIDEKSLEDLGLDLGRPVSFNGTVTARTALRAVLQSHGLTFVVKDEMIQVLTLEKAQGTLMTRSYYLGDLVAGNGQYGNAVLWGPVVSNQQAAETGRLIVDAITSSIDPMAWKTDRTNGPCTVSFNLATLSIVVRASAEVHASLGNSLSGKK